MPTMPKKKASALVKKVKNKVMAAENHLEKDIKQEKMLKNKLKKP